MTDAKATADAERAKAGEADDQTKDIKVSDDQAEGADGAPPAQKVQAKPVPDDATMTIRRPVGMTPPPTTAESAEDESMVAPPTSSVRVADAVRAARAAVSQATGRGPRRARLRLKRIDPWSVMKFSFALSIVIFVVIVVATTVLYITLDAMGVFSTVNEMISTFMASGSDDGSAAFRVTAKGVIGLAAILGVVNMVLFTALATLGAFIYNVCSDLVGGIEVTLAERD
ncbi:DUF3566 domain-containing protein [Salininema proteolyticum]|uniref:DUF3566 domain-containing protein n=1 Tax=Salininema proteolyticum TaxID=1607685 RepID=A0ABV8TU99_9ACTN